MRQGIGSVFIYNIIIVFIVITFGFLSATLSYMKAYKVNGRIANALEKYEGYNALSSGEINNTLSSLGYRLGIKKCETKTHNGHIYSSEERSDKSHLYCVYEYNNKANSDFHDGYFTYGITTYIFFDIPIIGGTFKIPVYSETESIFKFSS